MFNNDLCAMFVVLLWKNDLWAMFMVLMLYLSLWNVVIVLIFNSVDMSINNKIDLIFTIISPPAGA